MRLIKLMLLLQLTGFAVAPVAVAAVPAGQADALRARAASQGELRVIVQMGKFSQPIGALSGPARQARKQQIASLQSSLLTQLRLPGLRELTRFENIPFVLLAADSQAIDALARLPQVVSMQEDIPEGPNLASSLPVIGAASAWAQGFDGSGKTVVVMDTGVDTSHPFFPPSRLKAEACFSTSSAAAKAMSLCPGAASSSTAAGSGQDCPGNVSGCSHGTHVAGIAVGNDGVGPNVGVARGAGLISIQVFSCFSSTTSCTGVRNALSYPSDQIRAMEHVLVLSQSIDIAAVNMSLGGDVHTNPIACDAANAARKAAIDNLRSVGIATIVAAGNNSRRDAISQPGCISTAISVGNSTDADLIASTSNVANFLDLLAPGDSITSAAPEGGVFTMSGTSMAAPHVAGAFAILRQAEPDATIDEILSALHSTGTSVDDERANGVVNDMRRINLDLALALLDQPQPEISTSPVAGSLLDFGPVYVKESSAPLQVDITNSGIGELNLNCDVAGTNNGSFQLLQCPASIAALQSAAVQLKCTPQTVGNKLAQLVINTGDEDEAEVMFELSCQGQSLPGTIFEDNFEQP